MGRSLFVPNEVMQKIFLERLNVPSVVVGAQGSRAVRLFLTIPGEECYEDIIQPLISIRSSRVVANLRRAVLVRLAELVGIFKDKRDEICRLGNSIPASTWKYIGRHHDLGRKSRVSPEMFKKYYEVDDCFLEQDGIAKEWKELRRAASKYRLIKEVDIQSDEKVFREAIPHPRRRPR